MSERIKNLFGVNTPGDPRNIVLNDSPDSPTARERGVRCSLRQITLASCLWRLTDMVCIVVFADSVANDCTIEAWRRTAQRGWSAFIRKAVRDDINRS